MGLIGEAQLARVTLMLLIVVVYLGHDIYTPMLFSPPPETERSGLPSAVTTHSRGWWAL